MTDPGLTAELLIQGYASGVFPMADSRDSDEVYWVNPRKRGILPLNGFTISRSLAKRMRQGGYKVTLNDAFAEVGAGLDHAGEVAVERDRVAALAHPFR